MKNKATLLFIAIAGWSCLSVSVGAQTRFPTIAPEQYTAEQAKVAEEFLKTRKRAVYGPFEPLMYSPQVMAQASAMGNYLRYNSAFSNNLSEFAILITARAWSQDYEWSVHAPIARDAGIKPEKIQAILEGRRPLGMTDDEEMIYNFLTELNQNKSVSDETYAKLEKRFNKKGVIDLVGINGYYTFLAMQLNVIRQPIPKDGVKLPKFPS